MRGRCSTHGTLAAGFASAISASGYAQAPPPVDVERNGTPGLPAPDQSAPPPPVSSVRQQATGRGFTFYPSTPRLGGFRFSLGALFDAIDPEVMYGFNARVPQLVLDARYGLGKGWSIRGHLNSMFVTTELLFGGSYAWRAGNWSFEGTGSVGIYIGKLEQLGFDSLQLAPEYRPEFAVGYDFGHIAVSVHATLLLMGPERVRVGDVWAGLDNASVFAGHSEMVYVENTTRSDSVWYFGAGAMTTRANYALWFLFSDSPGLFTYPRVVAGYEF